MRSRLVDINSPKCYIFTANIPCAHVLLTFSKVQSLITANIPCSHVLLTFPPVHSLITANIPCAHVLLRFPPVQSLITATIPCSNVLLTFPPVPSLIWSLINNIIIIILLKQDYNIQLADNKIQMAWLTSWVTFESTP